MVTAYQNQTDRRNVQHSTVAVPQQNKIKTSSSSLKSEIKLLASRPDWSFLLTSLYFQFSLIQAGRVGWCVCSRMSDQWRVPAEPGLVTWPRSPHTRPARPDPIKRQIISRFPVCFPPSLRLIVLRTLCLRWWYFPVFPPAPLTPPSSLSSLNW